MPTTTKPRSRSGGSCQSATDGARPRPGTIRLRRLVGALTLSIFTAALIIIGGGGTLAAQSASQGQPASQGQSASQAPTALETALVAEPTSDTAALTFVNRPIAVFRSNVLGRRPQERVISARRVLDDLVAQHISGPVTAQVTPEFGIIRVNGQVVFALAPADADQLTGETLQQATDRAAVRLRQAMEEGVEALTPRRLLRSAALAIAGLVAGGLLLWGLFWLRGAAAARWHTFAAGTLARAGISDPEALRASRVLEVQHRVVTTLAAAIGLVVVYAVTTFVLRRFPFTRPWGESMREYLLTIAENIGLGIAYAIPGLFTAALIFLLVRFAGRLIGLWFSAIERGRVKTRWLYPDTVQPTRRLVNVLLWLFALIVAYPFLPGSGSDAFKGVSVFLGLMLTLGSSGLVNQFMSGLMLIYSRALRVGDFVRIGDIEGTVLHIGMISTKVRTLWQEEVTIPNAVVVTQNVIDYTRPGDVDGVYTRVSVTIGYDAPWRQVHALLLKAADRTPGLRDDPKPEVIQEALDDFYVRYTLLVCLKSQQSRPWLLNKLHGHIQDLFNEYGVQIMSPNYMIDPAAPKVVDKKDWFNAPARPSS